jgi:hypothetical protein
LVALATHSGCKHGCDAKDTLKQGSEYTQALAEEEHWPTRQGSPVEQSVAVELWHTPATHCQFVQKSLDGHVTGCNSQYVPLADTAAAHATASRTFGLLHDLKHTSGLQRSVLGPQLVAVHCVQAGELVGGLLHAVSTHKSSVQAFPS